MRSKYMTVTEFLTSDHSTAFSFEILPPIRGKSIEGIYREVDRLMEFSPAYVNITTHRTEKSYHQVDSSTYRLSTTRRRAGTGAIADVILRINLSTSLISASPTYSFSVATANEVRTDL